MGEASEVILAGSLPPLPERLGHGACAPIGAWRGDGFGAVLWLCHLGGEEFGTNCVVLQGAGTEWTEHSTSGSSGGGIPCGLRSSCPGSGSSLVLDEGHRACPRGPDCYDAFETYPTVLALRVANSGVLRLAGRLDSPGESQRVFEHDGRLILLTDEAVLLTDPDLRIRKRIPRVGG